MGAAATRSVDDALADDHLGAVEVGDAVAGGELHGDGGLDPGEHGPPVLPGLRGVDHGVERVVVDDDQLGGVGGRGPVDGDHGDHRLADVADDVTGEQGPGHLLVEEEGQLGGEVGQVQVGGGDHGEHPGRLAGLVDVDGLDAGEGQRGADEGHLGRVPTG